MMPSNTDTARHQGRLMPAPATPFNYDTLPAAMATSLRKQAARIRKGVMATTASIIAVGRDLITAKQSLEHSQFCEWVEAECVFSLRSAQNYMRAAEFAEGKNASVAFLQPITVYKLSAKSAPPEVVHEVIERAAKGEVISDRDVIAALNEAKFQKRQVDRKEKEATRRKAVSKPEIARREARRCEEEAEQQKKDEQWRAAALSIIDTVGEHHARFLVRALDVDIGSGSFNAWRILDYLVVELHKLDGDAAAAPKTEQDAAHDRIRFLPVAEMPDHQGNFEKIGSIDDAGAIDIPTCLRRGHPDCFVQRDVPPTPLTGGAT